MVDHVFAARSPLLLRVFGKLFERDLAASFHAVRCSGTVPKTGGPLVIFSNHPSWWDGELFVWLAATMFADCRVFSPMDAAMLERYRFFEKLGAFGVTARFGGAALFLAVGEATLKSDDGLLIVNAEGRFRDARDRPLQIKGGLARLACRVPHARFVPLAIECAFWDERRPNLLLRFGEAVSGEAGGSGNGARLAEALTETMDTLAIEARQRDPTRFTTLLAGSTGINAAYDAWRRLRALLRAQRFDPAHDARPGAR